MSQATLTADDLRQMLEVLNSIHQGESRNIERRQLCASLNIRLMNTSEVILVDVQDISLHGIGVVHTEAIDSETRFTIPSSKGPELTCSVIYCVPLDDGRFRIGGKFESAPQVNSNPIFDALKD